MTLEELYKANKSIGSTRYTGGSNFTSDKSNLNIDRIPSRYSMTGKLYTAGDTSKLNVDGISKKYHG
jgi:hypothetical protein